MFDEKVKDGSQAQAAVVVMSADGAVRAMIGGRDTTAAGTFNRATQAKRQTGSAFKPFVYAAALDQGFSPNDMIQDAPITIHIKGSKPWTPKNYTRNHLGQITLTTALAKSINTSTIRLQEAVGRENVRRVARDFGFAHDLTAGPSMGLGVSETTLLEMTGAYAGIRNGGTAVRPYGLVELRIKGDDKPLIGQAGGMGQRVISTKAASELIWMMRQVVDSGTGTRARLPGREVAGKTGTTSSYRDAWFIGFTEQYVTGVWMGYDDNKPLSGVTGGGLPAEIWHAVMEEIHENLPANPLGVMAPGGGGSMIVASDIVSADSDDPLAAALAAAVAAAQPVGGDYDPGGMGGIVPNAPPVSATMPDGSADPLAAALAEAMGQGAAPAEQMQLLDPQVSAPAPATPVPAPVPVQATPLTPSSAPPPARAPRSPGSTVSAAPAPSQPRTEAAAVGAAVAQALVGGPDARGASDAAAVGAALAEALAGGAPANLTSERAVNDALTEALLGLVGTN